jgi:hypothetical protein
MLSRKLLFKSRVLQSTERGGWFELMARKYTRGSADLWGVIPPPVQKREEMHSVGPLFFLEKYLEHEITLYTSTLLHLPIRTIAIFCNKKMLEEKLGN